MTRAPNLDVTKSLNHSSRHSTHCDQASLSRVRNIALRPINFCFVQIGAGGRPQPHRCRCWNVAERRIRAARTPTGLERTCIQSVDFDPVPTCGSWELLLRKMCHHSPRAGHWGLWPPPGNALKTAAAGFKPTAVIKMTLSCVAKHQADAGLIRGSRWRGYFFDIFVFFGFLAIAFLFD